MLRRIMFLSVLFLLMISGCGRDGIFPGPGTEVILLPSDLTPAVSSDGKYVAFFHISIDTSETTGLYILDLESDEKTLLLSGEVNNPDFSPDGKWLVFNIGDQIYKVRLKEDMRGVDTSTLSQLTFEGKNFFPAWSPDGNLIAFSSYRGEIDRIWLMDTNGNNQRELPLLDRGGINPDWSPDGTRLVFIGWTEEFSGVVISDTLGDNITYLGGGDDPAWSPDGEWIGYTVYGPGLRMKICVTRVDGSDQKELIEFNLRFDDSWTPAEPGGQVTWLDSHTLIFSAPNPETTRVVLWKINIDGTGLEQITF